MALLTSANTLVRSTSWCTHSWLRPPSPWSSQATRRTVRPAMPPCRLSSSTYACAPYCGPTNALGSNALLRLLMVPRVIVVGVTPTSEAVLRGAPGAAMPLPGTTDVTSVWPGPADAAAEAPGTGEAVPSGVAAGVPDVTCGASAWSAALKAASGSRVPHAASEPASSRAANGCARMSSGLSRQRLQAPCPVPSGRRPTRGDPGCDHSQTAERATGAVPFPAKDTEPPLECWSPRAPSSPL